MLPMLLQATTEQDIPPGNMRGMSRADGGRIGYEGGELVGEEFEDENTQEFMRDQGVPYSEMAEKARVLSN